MKKNLLLIFFAFVIKVYSQNYTAGTFYASYTDINPDMLLKYTVAPYTNQTYSVTVFGPGQPDVEFTAHGSVSSSGSAAYIKVSSLDPNVSIRFGRWDSVFVPGGPNWNVTKVARPLTLGELINAPGAIWDNTVLFLTDHSGFGGGNKNVNDWIGPDKYVGLKYQNGSTTSYGWIRVLCPSEDSCYVKEFSHPGTTTGIKETRINQIGIYPNPFNDYFYLGIDAGAFEPQQLKIVDLLGKEIKYTYEIKDNRIKIGMKEQPSGSYFLKYESGDKSFVSKLIKEAK